MALEDAGKDHVAHRQCRIERLGCTAAGVAQCLVAGAADPALPPRRCVQAQRHIERGGSGRLDGKLAGVAATPHTLDDQIAWDAMPRRRLRQRATTHGGASIYSPLLCTLFRIDPMETTLEALTAFGTIAVAVVAIWGDWLKSKLAPQRLALELDPEAEAVRYSNGVRGIFRHLKVVNLRPWTPAQQCRVMLVGLSRRDPGGGYQPVPMAFPCQFAWAPMEFMPIAPTVMKEQVVALGFINENGNAFLPKGLCTSVRPIQI